VRHVLAQRVAVVAGYSARTLAPLGLDPSLPPLMMREALAAAARGAFDPLLARLLVVGHGSNSRPNGASARATRRAAQLLAASRTFADISVAFLEEPPFLTDGLADRSRPTVVLGFFSGEGLHALEDVPAAIAELSASAVYTGPIGALPEIADIIARAIDAAASPPA
jgi:sirohydrochlorin ferrochelatase